MSAQSALPELSDADPVVPWRDGWRRRAVQVAATLLIAVGVTRPWLHVALYHDTVPTSLPLVLTGLRQIKSCSYGALVGVVLGVSVISSIRSFGRATRTTAIAGAAIIAIAVFFVVQSIVGNHTLVGQLGNNQAELRAIKQQFGYATPTAQLDSFLFFKLTGPSRTILNALRPGFGLTLFGGLLLLGNGWGKVQWRSWRYKVFAYGLVAAVLTVAVLSVTRAQLARNAESVAINDTHAGAYPAAVNHFRHALALDRSLGDDSVFAKAYGAALVGTGDDATPLALLSDAARVAASGDSEQSLRDLLQAHADDPKNIVISEALRGSLRAVARHDRAIAFLTSQLADPTLDVPANRYTLGRLLFDAGSYSRSIEQMQIVVQETNDLDVRSNALTFVAFSQENLGLDQLSRRTLLEAIATDHGYYNLLARTHATGLYDPFSKQ